ncbi:MAG: lysis protein [Rhodocyclaceae bacterium]|nr:lysis protein [Rhodocyclaceae bacterium]
MIALAMRWLDVALPLWRIVAAFTVVAAFAAAIWWIRGTGVQAERAEWVAKMATAKAEWQAELDKANAANRATERQSAQVIADVSTYYQTELKNVQAQKTADRADVQRGALRLFDPFQSFRLDANPILPRSGEACTTAGRRDGETGRELSREVTGDLLDFANDANAIVSQLTAAQAVIIEYQRVCGATANAAPPR